jgi:hypothetical protein
MGSCLRRAWFVGNQHLKLLCQPESVDAGHDVDLELRRLG